MVTSWDSAAAFLSFLQDPVYGKGKLGEIQGLVLGMLETFNYEQVSCIPALSEPAGQPAAPSALPLQGRVNGRAVTGV